MPPRNRQPLTGEVRIVDDLIERLRVVLGQRRENDLAISHAAQRFHPSTLKAMNIAEQILEATHGQAINYRDKRGTTPLMQACQKVSN